MVIKQYLNMKAKERKYLHAVRAEAKAYLNVLEAADLILGFNGDGMCMSCFDSYPIVKEPIATKRCERFEENTECKSTTCPLKIFNKFYIDACSAREDARIQKYKVQTEVLAAKVRG